MDNYQETILQRRKRPVKISREEQVLMLRAYLAHPSDWAKIFDDVNAHTDQLNERTINLYISSPRERLTRRLISKIQQLMSKSQVSIADQEIRALVGEVRNARMRLHQCRRPKKTEHHVSNMPPVPHVPPVPKVPPVPIIPLVRHVTPVPKVSPAPYVLPAPRKPPVSHVTSVPLLRPVPHVRSLPFILPAPHVPPVPNMRPVRYNIMQPGANVPVVPNIPPDSLVSPEPNGAVTNERTQAATLRRRRNPKEHAQYQPEVAYDETSQEFTNLALENQMLYNRFMRKTVPKILRELDISSGTEDSD